MSILLRAIMRDELHGRAAWGECWWTAADLRLPSFWSDAPGDPLEDITRSHKAIIEQPYRREMGIAAPDLGRAI